MKDRKNYSAIIYISDLWKIHFFFFLERGSKPRVKSQNIETFHIDDIFQEDYIWSMKNFWFPALKCFVSICWPDPKSFSLSQFNICSASLIVTHCFRGVVLQVFSEPILLLGLISSMDNYFHDMEVKSLAPVIVQVLSNLDLNPP